MAIVAVVAVGLNPYVATFILAALAAFTSHLPLNYGVTPVGATALAVVALLMGMAVPVDLVLTKFVRTAPSIRHITHLVAPMSGALVATVLAPDDIPLPVVAALGGGTAWMMAVMVTGAAARASRSPAWVGLGHIPVLMSAATAAACMVPLGIAKPGIGQGLAAVASSALVWATVAGLRHRFAAGQTHRRRAARVLPGLFAGSRR